MSESEFEGHEALIAQMRAGTFDAPGHLHRRVLALREKRARVPMSRRKKLLLAVPIAVTLAMGAAVVHGAFFAGSNSSAKAPYPNHTVARFTRGVNGAFGAPGPTGPKGPTGANGATGAQGATGASGLDTLRPANRKALGTPPAKSSPAGPAGPGGLTGANGSTYSLGSFDAAAAQSRGEKAVHGTSITIPQGRLVHAIAYINVGVPSVSALTHATNEATQIVTGLGGYTQNSQINASSKNYGRAFLDLRVPLAHTQTAIDKLGRLGHVLSQSVSTQDLVQQAKQETNQIDQLQRAIAIYKQALASGTLSATERVDIQVKLSNAEHEIAGTRKQHSRTVKSGTTAEIRMSLATTHQAAVARHHKTGRLGQMLHNMGNFLGWEGIIVLYILLVVVPIVLLGALVWWILRERRRREERLLAANA